MRNTGYFLKETYIIIRRGLLSNILSLFSTGLIFFILATVLSGWWIGREAVGAIGDQAEISVYYHKDISRDEALKLSSDIKGIGGVRASRLIDEKEAYARMVKILGKESGILKVFGGNPFTSYIEVKVNLDSVDNILKDLKRISAIEYIRDNREILDRLAGITRLLMLAGWLVLAAAGISTLVIVSHIIRLAIQDNREQINTLKLLGAPGYFIAFPFLLQGLLLAVGGGLIASVLAAAVLRQAYGLVTGPLPFIPLPPLSSIISGMFTAIIIASALLGAAGSLLGLSSKRRD